MREENQAAETNEEHKPELGDTQLEEASGGGELEIHFLDVGQGSSTYTPPAKELSVEDRGVDDSPE